MFLDYLSVSFDYGFIFMSHSRFKIHARDFYIQILFNSLVPDVHEKVTHT